MPNLTETNVKNLRIKNRGDNNKIPYGRGAAAIALQVKAETGSKRPVEDIAVELATVVEAWKTKTYPDAWAFMESSARCVYDPGYVVNPWGRRRRFINIKESRPDMERQAQNFPIQSTVADTMGIALTRVLAYREEHGLHFQVPNQIHDALKLYAPRDTVEECEEMLRTTMGGIPIPVGGVVGTLTLKVDVEVNPERWGDK